MKTDSVFHRSAAAERRLKVAWPFKAGGEPLTSRLGGVLTPLRTVAGIDRTRVVIVAVDRHVYTTRCSVTGITGAGVAVIAGVPE